MTTLNLLHFGRTGFESRILARRAHRFDLHSEELEFRRLMSTGHVGAPASPVPNPAIATGASEAPATSTAPSASAATSTPQHASTSVAVANATTAAQANVPIDNSSTQNTASVSPMTPAPLNVVTDDSASVTSAAIAAISSLNPNMTSAFTASSDAPVLLVPEPVPPTTIELFIETPSLQASNTPVTFQANNFPVMLHAINSPVGFQANNNPSVAVQNQPPPTIQHIGQSIDTELQKLLGPHLGPQSEEPLWIDIVEPPQPLEPAQPPKTESPKTEPPKTEPPKTEPPTDQAPPAQDVPPVPAPVPHPVNGGAPPAASGASSAQAMGPSMKVHTGLSTLFGVAAVIGGGSHLAMRESERFGMLWLPSRAASARSARPRIVAR
jgi:hypothetical protein